MQELGLMERFADPVLFESLTTGEKLTGGLITTLMGMGTTFTILFLLWGVIAFISSLIRKADKKPNMPAQSTGTIGTTPSGEATVSKPVAASAIVESGQEIVAVIMAAIAASQGAEVASKLRIRKIERLSGNRTPWNAAGSAECIESRKF